MDEGFAIEVMGKRESYEDDAERVMSLVASAETWTRVGSVKVIFAYPSAS